MSGIKIFLRGKPVSTEVVHKGCPLFKTRVQTRGVPTYRYGPGARELFIIAEAPGKSEDEDGEPMTGSAGKISRTLLAQAGLRSYCLGNIVRCRTPDNREPDPAEIQICLPHTLAEIGRAKPKVVLLMGKTAANAVLGTKSSMNKLRGWHAKTINGHECQIYVTYHPSLLHYHPDSLRTICDDLALVARYMRGEPVITDLQYQLTDIRSLTSLKAAIKDTLVWKGPIAIDFETPSLDRIGVRPTTFCWGCQRDGDGGQDPQVYGIALEHPQSPWDGETYPEVRRLIRGLFVQLLVRQKQKLVELVAHGAKFEAAIFRDWQDLSLSPLTDTMQQAHAVDENRVSGGGFSLEALANSWLGISSEIWDGKTSDLIYGGAGKIYKASPAKVVDHNAKDVVVTLLLRDEVQSRALNQGLDLDQPAPLYARLPFLFAAVERNGMPVDINYLSQLRANSSPLQATMQQILTELNALPAVRRAVKLVRGGTKKSPLFGGNYGDFKVTGNNNRAHLSALFFDVLKLPQEEETKTGLKKIDKTFFEEYKNIPEVQLVSEYRSLDTLVTRYLVAWWNCCKDAPDARIRAHISSTTAVTGRTSVSNPGLQQIPRGKTKGAKIIKKVFCPSSPDRNHPRVLVAGDYSQAELRWLAEISQDPAMSAVFIKRAELLEQYSSKPSAKLAERINLECDLHRSTYSEMYGKKIIEVTEEDRNVAKALNFGIGYGMGPDGLSARLGCGVEEAAEQLEKWMTAYSGARDWFQAIEKYASRHGYVTSPIGRRRHLDALLLKLSHGPAHGHLLRVARNAPIQSIASDMTLWAAIRIQHYVEKHKRPWLLCGLVHDSIITDLPLDDVLEYVEVTTRIAEDRELLAPLGYPRLRVPMEFESSVGRSYGEQTKLTTNVGERAAVIEKMHKELRQMVAA